MGLGRVRLGLGISLIPTMEAMQFNAKKCRAKEVSMTVDIELVEVDGGESRRAQCDRGPPER